MKRKIIGVCLLIFGLAGFYFFINTENIDNQRVKKIADIDQSEMTVDEIFRARIKKKHEKDLSDKLKFDNPDAYFEYELGIRTRKSEHTPGYRQGNSMVELRKATSDPNFLLKRSLRTSSLQWTERGPANVPGRTRAILPLPVDPLNVWLAGSVGGGIWKTVDGGLSWQNKTADLPSLAISWLALCKSQPDIIYASTGEAIGGSVGLGGNGVFKSMDGGESWFQLPSTNEISDFKTINRIIVDPNNPDIVLLCYSQGEWEKTFKSGIYKSIDGGASWYKVYDANAWILQIISNPENFRTMYAPVWAKGIVKSVDGGETWFESNNGFNKVFGRIELAISPTDTSRLYGSAQGNLSGSGADLYTSIDAGETWSFIDQKYNNQAVDFFRGQGDYDNTIVVNPYNADEVYYGGVNLWRTRISLGETEVPLSVVTLEVSADTLSYWNFMNFGAEYFNGRLELGANLSENEKLDVEVRSGPGKHQLAHRFTVDKKGSGVPDSLYVYRDYVEVPFEVWDMDHNRQLMMSFRDQQEDSVFNLIYTNTDDPNTANQSREYFYIHSVDYDVNPNSKIAQASGDTIGYKYKLLYFFWPTLRNGHTWDAENLPLDTIKINYDLINIKQGTGTMIPVSDAYEDYMKLNSAYTATGGLFNFHPDHHNLMAIPINASSKTFAILNSNDGGVYISDPDSIPGTKDGSWHFAGNGFNTGQFYSAAKRPGENQYLGGLQDNGTWRSPKDEDASQITKYNDLYGGDGFDVLWNYQDPTQILISLYQNQFYRSQNDGRTWIASSNGITGISPFFSKLASSNSNPNQVFTVSSEGVFRSTDFGKKWSKTAITDNWGFSNFIDVKVSLYDHNIIWAGSGMSDNLNMFVSTDGGKQFKPTANFEGAELGFISGLATHPTQDSTAFVLYSFAGGPKILRTTDLGKTWEDISGFHNNTTSDNGFPDVAVYSLLVRPDNPEILWAGTEIGIFESDDEGATWTFLESGLGAASVWEMNVMDDQVVIATHGRGIFTATLSETQEIVIVPQIVAAGTTVSGEFIVKLGLNSVYDSTFISINGFKQKLFQESQKGTFTPTFTDIQPNDSIPIALYVYRKGKKYEANSLIASHFKTSEPVGVYFQDFNSGTDDFTGNGFEVKENVGFDNPAIQSIHPYEQGDGFDNDQLNYIFNLKTPIIVSGRNSTVEYDDVVLVEIGEIGSKFPQEQFYDYVVLEGTTDGLTWIPIGTGYDSGKNARWTSTYNTKNDGNASLFIKEQVELVPYFSDGDTILLRFRLFSDQLTTGWGWAIDNLGIQVPITGLDDLEIKKETHFSIYPNPASGVVNLEFETEQESDTKVYVYSLQGGLVLQQDFGIQAKGKHLQNMNTSMLLKGLYIVQLRIGNHISTSKLQIN